MIVKNPLITADWLYRHLAQPDLKILDCSWYLPMHQRDAKAEFAAGHIEGAQFFDVDAISSKATTLPHMLPSAQDFAKAMGAMGISDASTIIIYDGLSVFSAPRVWWMFIVFGATNVHILDGGLPAWKAKSYPLTQAVKTHKPQIFKAGFQPDLVAGMADVKQALADKTQVVDARSAGRFDGTDPEFRAGLKSGHMPGALNMPQSTLVKNGFFLRGNELIMAFEKAGVDVDSQIITSCGSGLTAASLALGLAVLGKPVGKLYDGSWTEWASIAENPIETLG